MKAKIENLDQYISIEKVCEKLEISKGTVYNLFKRKALLKTKVTSKTTRVKASDVQKYLDSRTA